MLSLFCCKCIPYLNFILYNNLSCKLLAKSNYLNWNVNKIYKYEVKHVTNDKFIAIYCSYSVYILPGMHNLNIA